MEGKLDWLPTESKFGGLPPFYITFLTHAVCCNSLHIALCLYLRFPDSGTRLTDVVETLLAICCVKHIKLCVSNKSTQFQLVFHGKKDGSLLVRASTVLKLNFQGL